MRLAPLALAALGAACAAAPPVFVQGDARTWTLPLVGPLENADLVVSVLIEGKGPYLFAVDPDTPGSKIDAELAERLQLYRAPGEYARVLGSDGVSRPFPIFEIQHMKVGDDLPLRNFRALGTPAKQLWFNDRPVAGVLGSNIFTSTMVLDIDRDAGLLRVALTGQAVPPSLGHAVEGKLNYGAFFVPVSVEGQELRLMLHLGTRYCSLWPRVAERLGVPFGHDVEKVRQLTAAVPVLFGPRQVTVRLAAGVEAKIAFTSLYDKLASEIRLDGLIGHNLLARYRVMVDRDHARLWFAPRDGDLRWRAPDRLARWGAAFAGCAAPGCVETVLLPGPELLVRKSPGAAADAWEVVLEPLGAGGQPLSTPLLRVSFDRAGRDVRVADPRFAGILAHAASFRVVDVSPFGAECAGGCVEAVDRLPR